jgi:sugar-specific transcriptional regulator TrmB
MVGANETGLLEEMGLTRNEAKTYLALCKLGPASASSTATAAGIHRSLAYGALAQLVAKGFASYTKLEGKQVYQATPPSKLKALFEEKQEKLREGLEELSSALQKVFRGAPQATASVYMGIAGIKSVMTDEIDSMKPGEVLKLYRAQPKITHMAPVFVSWWHKKRAEKGIEFRALYDKNEECMEYAKRFKEGSLVSIKFVDAKFVAPVTYHISGNRVVLISVAEDDSLAVMIENPGIKKSFEENFDYIWRSQKMALRTGGKTNPEKKKP